MKKTLTKSAPGLRIPFAAAIALSVSPLFFPGAGVAAKDAGMPVAKMRESFVLEARVLMLAPDGKRPLDVVREKRIWKGMSDKGEWKRDWMSVDAENAIRLRQTWAIGDDGRLHARIEEFKGDVKGLSGTPDDFKDSLGAQDYDVGDFAPIAYRLKNTKENIQIQFIPSLEARAGAQAVKDLPIAGKGIAIYDSSGNLWAKDVDFGERFVGATTHMGTVLLSYEKFDGADLQGVAEGNRITIRGAADGETKGATLTLQGDSLFVPFGLLGRVYARIFTEKKSPKLNSVHILESTSRDRFNRRVKDLAK